MAASGASVASDSSASTIQRRETNAYMNYRKDPYYIHPSDNLGLQIVSIPLTLNNYLIWSRSMEVVLLAKNKLCFVDGTCTKPEDPTSDLYSQWHFVDSMVFSWIINAMSKELVEAYIYAKSARQVWIELKEKYGESDNPQIFNLRKHMATMAQGNDSLALYSKKLKKHMDELNCLEPRPQCICGKCTCNISKRLEEIYCANDVMQLLMGLNETYDTMVCNIMMMEHLPPFNKAYSMISRVEK